MNYQVVIKEMGRKEGKVRRVRDGVCVCVLGMCGVGGVCVCGIGCVCAVVCVLWYVVCGMYVV